VSRTERIAAAQALLDAMGPEHDRIVAARKEAARALQATEDSYDIGERVRVVQTCRRGCCIESDFRGAVEGMTDNGQYNVRDGAGHLWTYVYGGDMKRV
jgi:hypothetical protein